MKSPCLLPHYPVGALQPLCPALSDVMLYLRRQHPFIASPVVCTPFLTIRFSLRTMQQCCQQIIGVLALLVPLKSIHSLEPDLWQSNNPLARLPQRHTVSVFLDHWPHLVSHHLIGIDRLDLLIMDHLSLDGGSLHETCDSVE